MGYKKSYIMKQINDIGMAITYVVVEEVSPYKWTAWLNSLTPIKFGMQQEFYGYIKPYKILISYEEGKFSSVIYIDIIYNSLDKSSEYIPTSKIFELKVLYSLDENEDIENIVIRKIKEIYGL